MNRKYLWGGVAGLLLLTSDQVSAGGYPGCLKRPPESTLAVAAPQNQLSEKALKCLVSHLQDVGGTSVRIVPVPNNEAAKDLVERGLAQVAPIQMNTPPGRPTSVYTVVTQVDSAADVHAVQHSKELASASLAHGTAWKEIARVVQLMSPNAAASMRSYGASNLLSRWTARAGTSAANPSGVAAQAQHFHLIEIDCPGQ